MIDLVWNFPLLEEQSAMWRKHLAAAMQEYGAEPLESLRPSFRTVDGSLRARAAKLLGFPVERTWITCGGHHGTLTALLASGLAGQRVVADGDSYPGFLNQCRFTRTELVPCAYDEEGMVPDALREICRRGNVQGLFLMPTVQNPLGFVMPLKRREELVAIAREFDLKIIEDDAYGYLEPEPPSNFAELAPERAFYVRGLAKSFAPGARTGFLVAPESASATITTAMVATATGTAVPQNMAGLALMEDGTLDKLMEDKRAEGAARNSGARALLGEMCAPGAKSAWHVWVRLRDGVNGNDVVEAMKRKDVMISPGDGCAAGPGYGRGLRLALGAGIKRERTLEGVARVAEYLRRA